MCQRTIFSANLQDPRQANGLRRQDPQRQLLGSSASTRPSAPTSRILGKQTTCSADDEESWPANDVQRQLRGSSASKPFSANPQDPRQANDSANPEDPWPASEHERQLLTSPNFQRRVPTKRPSRLRLEVLFVSLLIRLRFYERFFVTTD